MNRAPHRGFFLYNRNYAIIFIPFICSKIHLAEWIAIKSKQKLKITVNLVALALFVGMIIYLSLRFTPQVLSLYKRRHEFERAVKDQGLTGIAAFILLQVLQIVDRFGHGLLGDWSCNWLQPGLFCGQIVGIQAG